MKYSLNSGENNALWYVKDYHKDDLSTKFFNETEWIPATVPGTIFVDAVNAGLEKNLISEIISIKWIRINIIKIIFTGLSLTFRRIKIWLRKEYG